MRTLPLVAFLLLSLPSLASASEPPPEWFQRAGAGTSGLSATFWAPFWKRKGETRHVDLTFRAAAALKGDAQAVYVLLSLRAKNPPRPALTRARLHLADKKGQPLAPLKVVPLGIEPAGPKGGRWQLAFPRAVLEAPELRLVVPVLDGAPLVVELVNVAKAAGAAQTELEAWTAYTRTILHVSAILPYLDHASARAFLARDERLVVPLLLRELARTAPGQVGGPKALPRFVVWHALVRTAWGKAKKLEDGGAPGDVTNLLERWRREGGPSIRGVVDPQDLVKGR